MTYSAKDLSVISLIIMAKLHILSIPMKGKSSS
jgi:hypothetical protein